MKKIFFAGITLVVVVLSLFSAVSAYAAVNPGQIPDPGIGNPGAVPQSIGGWVDVAMTVVKWFYTIIFIVAIFFILMAAFDFVTSKGDEKKIGDARKLLTFAIVGIIVALISFGIVRFVQNTVSSQLVV